ncbi:hypothetical protein H105_00354 [Trichophyton soudanense CBS 452.61]|uniref:Uncharacterized protein n=1 Tax=Trichophyton soudanense CBS 452.61 TaxID=1215331 RepID=A0A022Y7P9_TRISD|nr:hypothetical protein H105_00354 [Trichophyton soudanense CBS 452.61]EZG10995.1 hypothetical protein H106_00249 [Trichophyton rubrum CBS 735.88]
MSHVKSPHGASLLAMDRFIVACLVEREARGGYMEIPAGGGKGMRSSSSVLCCIVLSPASCLCFFSLPSRKSVSGWLDESAHSDSSFSSSKLCPGDWTAHICCPGDIQLGLLLSSSVFLPHDDDDDRSNHHQPPLWIDELYYPLIVTGNAHWTECHIGKSPWLAVPPSYHPQALGGVSRGLSDINSRSGVDYHPQCLPLK